MNLSVDVLEQILAESRLSPEQLGSRMGVSGMTIRRWIKASRPQELAPLYSRGLMDCVHLLLQEGQLKPESPWVQEILSRDPHPAIRSALSGLGLSPENALKPSSDWSERMIELLTQIGADSDRQSEVMGLAKPNQELSSRLQGYFGLGNEWRSRILSLLEVIRSRELPSMQKFVAVGALFYLITPFDLIPDHLPVIGLLDDYAVLGLAAAYYARHFARAETKAEAEAEIS